MNQSGRERATRHCLECGHHWQDPTPTAPHTCRKLSRSIGHSRVRTSPDWCPLGHLIPGKAYPIFEPGTDPRYTRAEAERFRDMARPR